MEMFPVTFDSEFYHDIPSRTHAVLFLGLTLLLFVEDPGHVSLWSSLPSAETEGSDSHMSSREAAR